MALAREYQREIPAFALVSEYSVARLGEFPSVRVTFDEVVYLCDLTGTVTAAVSHSGKFTELHMVGWQDRTDLVDRTLCLSTNVLIGKIVSAEVITVPPVTEGDPDLSYMKLMLDDGPTTTLTNLDVGMITLQPMGSLCYRASKAGARWELHLDGGNPAAMARMTQMLGTGFFKALKSGLTVLGLTSVTDAQILGAVQALGAAGINLDSILAEEGEALEVDRRNGTFTDVVVFGDAP